MFASVREKQKQTMISTSKTALSLSLSRLLRAGSTRFHFVLFFVPPPLKKIPLADMYYIKKPKPPRLFFFCFLVWLSGWIVLGCCCCCCCWGFPSAPHNRAELLSLFLRAFPEQSQCRLSFASDLFLACRGGGGWNARFGRSLTSGGSSSGDGGGGDDGRGRDDQRDGRRLLNAGDGL